MNDEQIQDDDFDATIPSGHAECRACHKRIPFDDALDHMLRCWG